MTHEETNKSKPVIIKFHGNVFGKVTPWLYLPHHTMRVALLYIWLFVTILPTFSQWGTIAYYHINKDYIARVLCENRDRPQLHCDGQCYLAKKLKAQEEKKDQQTSEQVRNLPTLHLFSSPLVAFEFLASPFLIHSQAAFQYQLAAYLAPLTIVSPPPCA
ncbi:hypothetical protein [Dyadobacter sp. CY351]|uniref:hypothetical protein n=1 Tax=Dyadobacter sp. CY351 TaxID=2909337 RepID=UPI00286E941B|nr:hypothetical protein [Dyadobacter sp. CY351]